MTSQQTILLDGLAMMAQIFWGPSAGTCADMVKDKYLRRLEALVSLFLGRSDEALHQIVTIIRAFPDGDSLYQHLEEGYVRMFISAREGIAAPLYASCYEFPNAPMMGKPAMQMKERFESKGLSMADDIKEPPDHLCLELEYLYFLLEKGWREEDSSLVDEAAAFASDTMLPWVSKFQRNLATEKECRFYPLIGSILIEILNDIGGSAGSEPGA